MTSVTHTRTFTVAAPADVLFPLFSPEGEKLWVPGWDYTDVMGTSGLAEDDVFLTAAHDHRSADAVWIVKTYDTTSRRVTFYKIEPGEKVGVVSVTCRASAVDRTEVTVGYRYTALSARGEEFLAGFTAEAYEEFIDGWQTALQRHLDRER